MAVTCGFFNGADRAANATDVCSIFDGLISDGIYDTVGSAFAVTAAGGNYLNLGTGRAWFNHTWTKNDAVVVLEAPAAELLLNRYDCVVLEVDHSDAVRWNRIFVLSGTPASTPSLPALSNGPLKFQYLLASVYRAARSTEIVSLNITPYQGSAQTPFVNALVEKFDIAAILTQYSDRAMELIEDLEAAYQLIQETGIPPHASTHGSGSTDPISPASIGAAIPPKVYLGKTVLTSAWVTDPTNKVPTHTKRAPISCPGVTASMNAFVEFSDADLALDLYSIRSDTATDIVYIYARSVPASTLTLLLVEAKLVSVVS